MPDNGLASLAASLQINGHNVVIHDLATVDFAERVMMELKEMLHTTNIPFQTTDLAALRCLNQFFNRAMSNVESAIAEELHEKVFSNDMHIVGFKLWMGRSSHVSAGWARRLKSAYPSLRVIYGGPQVSIFRDRLGDLLDLSYVDALFIGEAEQTLVNYLSNCTSFVSCSNATFWEAKHSYTICNEREAIPIPEYHPATYPSLNTGSKLLFFLIEDSIGCPNKCAFCNRPGIHPGRYTRHTESIWRQIDNLYNNCGASVFKLAGSNTSAELLKRLAKTRDGREFQFMCFGDFREYSLETVNDALQLGVRWIFFGLESASKNLLVDSYGKHIDPEAALEVIRACKHVGIATTVSLIYPGPNETERSKEQTLRWLEQAQPTSVVIQMPSVLYGSKWYANFAEYGFDTDYQDAVSVVFNQDHHAGFYLPFGSEEAPPFRVNGWSHERTCQKLAEFGDWVIKRFPTCTEDYLACAHLLGYTGAQDQFNRIIRGCLYGGDTNRLRQILRQINNRILTNYTMSQ
jgi:radical SAM superfamily enzyme YgiQ (UPF0313 family)